MLYVPIDERFATRQNFLNLATLIEGDYEILTPPVDIICKLKQPANLDAL